jgi:hypothetical protein
MNQKDESYAFFSPPALKIKDGIIICSATMSSSGKPQKIQIPFTIINDNLAQVHGYDGLGGSKLQVHKNNDGSEYILFMGFELKKE